MIDMSAVRALLVAGLLSGLALPVCAQTQAEQYQEQQSVLEQPPVGSSLARLLALVGCNEEFAWNAGPGAPAGAPQGATQIQVGRFCSHSTWNVDCLTLCDERSLSISLLIVFADGSEYTYRRQFQRIDCGDGETFESSVSRDSTDSASLGEPNAYRIRGETETVETRQQERTTTRRSYASLQAPAGATLQPGNNLTQATSSLDQVDLRVGSGGTLDLTGFSAGAPILTTPQPVTIFADTILLDPGVALPDIFGAAPVVSPADDRIELDLRLSSWPCMLGGIPDQLRVTATNSGNTAEDFFFSWSDSRGWSSAGDQTRSVAPGRSHDLIIDLAISFSAAPCDATDFVVTALLPGGETVRQDFELFADGDLDGDGIENSCDTCSGQSDPFQEDADLDGSGDLCDICPGVFNPFQLPLALPESIRAHDKNTLGWARALDISFIKGDLAQVADYVTTDDGSASGAVALDITTDQPAAGEGLYYLLRPLQCGSWQTGPYGEPRRDLMLP